MTSRLHLALRLAALAILAAAALWPHGTRSAHPGGTLTTGPTIAEMDAR